MKRARSSPTKQKSASNKIVRRSRSWENTALATRLPDRIEQALIGGNLINLSPEERVSLTMATCKSLRLNPLTSPFIYILVKDWDSDDTQEKLILYASRNCTDQLRNVRHISDVKDSLKRYVENEMLHAEISVTDPTGKITTDLGVIPLERYSRKRGAYKLQGAMLANAKMHVVTKARRRATLAHCGLGGIVDEAELDTMRVVGGVTKEGRIFRYPESPNAEMMPQLPAARELDETAPQGQDASSPKAKVAENTLKAVEEDDRRLAEERAKKEQKSSPSPESAPQRIPIYDIEGNKLK